MLSSGTIKATAAALCAVLLAACGDMFSQTTPTRLRSFDVPAEVLDTQVTLDVLARKHGAKVRRDPSSGENPFTSNYLAMVAEGGCLLTVNASHSNEKGEGQARVTLEATDGSECTPRMRTLFGEFEKELRDYCHVRVGPGDVLFLGNPECLAKLPKQRMSGVWVHGFEHSIFYEGASRVPAHALDYKREDWKTDVWMEAHPEDLLERHGYKFDGSTRAYRIDFIGAKSEARGVYGHAGMFRRGAVVTRILKIEELPFQAS